LRLQPAAPAVSLDQFICQMQAEVDGITRSSTKPAATVAIHRAAPCAIVPPGRFTPGAAEPCCGRRLASRHVCCARLLSPSAVCTQQMMTQGAGRPAAPTQPAAAPAPRARLYAVCHGPLPTAEAALGLQPAAPAVSLDQFICQMQAEVDGITRSSIKPAATVAIHRAAPCAVAPPSRFTSSEHTSCAAVDATRARLYAAPRQCLRAAAAGQRG
jgi:hypothetical protein